jgi:DNA-binding response OmpR family regulator
VLCDPDVAYSTVLTQVLTDAGFDLVGDVQAAADAVRVATMSSPRLVLITNELVGTLGTQVIGELLSIEPEPLVVVLMNDMSASAHALADGAFAAAPRHGLEAVAEVLADARHLLETGERRGDAPDRRAGEDRRKHQDWTKVTSQRRSGDDRRKGDRRTDDPQA